MCSPEKDDQSEGERFFERGALMHWLLFAEKFADSVPIICHFLASGRLFLGNAELLLNDFSELYQNLALILKKAANQLGFS